MSRLGRGFAALLAAIALTACGTVPRGGGYYLDDGPDAAPAADVSKVPDAVPQREPRAAYGNNNYTALGVRYTPMPDAKGYRERGVASWYGKKFHGHPTSSREPYDMYAMTAAHKTLPLPSYVRVHNLQNGRAVIVRVNDRGPFLHDRVIDLSYAAAYKLGIVGTGTGLVEVEAVEPEETTPVAVTTQPATLPPRHPGLEIVSTAAADASPPPPKLYLQIGAFTRSENAENLRARLEQAAFKPVFVQPPANATAPLYRVRIGPLTGVEEGDRLGEQLRALGHADTRIVVE
ncbi:MAG: septal ring lytic transglycosylase RlpA family protein [Gammaproteobacteria bacterium]|nr:septal ring lytic transglycosylase RlpA family protein [Gammaproteobacteria bacterium]